MLGNVCVHCECTSNNFIILLKAQLTKVYIHIDYSEITSTIASIKHLHIQKFHSEKLCYDRCTISQDTAITCVRLMLKTYDYCERISQLYRLLRECSRNWLRSAHSRARVHQSKRKLAKTFAISHATDTHTHTHRHIYVYRNAGRR